MKTRNLIPGLMLVLSLFTATVVAHPQTDAHAVATVTAGALNLRSGPGVRFAPIAVLRGGQIVQILAQRHGWSRVRVGHLSGWASSAFIQYVRHSAHRHQRAPHHNRPRFAVIGPNRFGFANMFVRKGRSGRVLAQLFTGERVRIVERGRRWTLVAKRGVGRGYVRSRFLVRI